MPRSPSRDLSRVQTSLAGDDSCVDGVSHRLCTSMACVAVSPPQHAPNTKLASTRPLEDSAPHCVWPRPHTQTRFHTELTSTVARQHRALLAQLHVQKMPPRGIDSGRPSADVSTHERAFAPVAGPHDNQRRFPRRASTSVSTGRPRPQPHHATDWTPRCSPRGKLPRRSTRGRPSKRETHRQSPANGLTVARLHHSRRTQCGRCRRMWLGCLHLRPHVVRMLA